MVRKGVQGLGRVVAWYELLVGVVEKVCGAGGKVGWDGGWGGRQRLGETRMCIGAATGGQEGGKGGGDEGTAGRIRLDGVGGSGGGIGAGVFSVWWRDGGTAVGGWGVPPGGNGGALVWFYTQHIALFAAERLQVNVYNGKKAAGRIQILAVL